jgi:uncharacterized protein
MNGFLVMFFTQQNHRQQGKPICDWLIALARDLKLRGVTVIPATEGFGQAHRLHSAHFFELADQPMVVLITVDHDECERLFARLAEEKVQLFYVKQPVEFGALGGAAG